MGNLSTSEVIFTDDSPTNIEVAKEMGFETHLFTDETGLGEKLRKMGIL